MDTVAPLAQTGMLKDCGPSFLVAPGRAGRASRDDRGKNAAPTGKKAAAIDMSK
ncbi:MAG: hypothetical protein IMY87_01870 [Chloroflexi bacterium]|nr:hypothetical protein [Chloroflexota bacterium]